VIHDEARIERAQAFLQEGVFRSRASQALTSALRQPAAAGLGNCGLGEKAAVELDLSARGRELFDELWADPAQTCDLVRMRALMAGWIKKQDALDRKLNHFLKEFRQRHGFDRTRYDAQATASYDAGLAELHREQDRARREVALELLEL